MLEVGNGGMSDSEYIIHMSMVCITLTLPSTTINAYIQWAMQSSPLIMGTDIRVLTPGNYSIYANPAVPASMGYPHDLEGGDQDSVGKFLPR